MSHHDTDPLSGANSNQQTPKEIRHSGDLAPEQGGEYPVRDFDNTTLGEAMDDHIGVPHTVEEGFQSVPLSPEEQAHIQALREQRGNSSTTQERKSHKKGIFAGIGGVVTAAVAAGAVVLSHGGGQEPNQNPNQDPTRSVATGSVNPGSSETSTSTSSASAETTIAGNGEISLPSELKPENLSKKSPEELKKLFEIPANQAKTPQQVAEVYSQRLLAFYNAGFTPSEVKQSANAGTVNFANKNIATYGSPAAESLLSTDQVNPSSDFYKDKLALGAECLSNNGLQTMEKQDTYKKLGLNTPNYSVSAQLDPTSIKSSANTDGSTNETFTLNISSNFDTAAFEALEGTSTTSDSFDVTIDLKHLRPDTAAADAPMHAEVVTYTSTDTYTIPGAQ